MEKPLLGTVVLIACLSYSSLADAQPTLTRFAPPSGPIGTLVKLDGTNLLNATAVAFNGVPSIVTQMNAAGTSFSAAVPPGATTGPITVTTPGGTATTSTAFVVSDVPTRDRHSLSSAPALRTPQ